MPSRFAKCFAAYRPHHTNTHAVAARDILPVVINSKRRYTKLYRAQCVCHNTLGDTLGISVRSKHNCTPKRLRCMYAVCCNTGIVVARGRSRLKKVVCFPCTRTRTVFAHDGPSTYGEVIRAAASQTVLMYSLNSTYILYKLCLVYAYFLPVRAHALLILHEKVH